MSTFLSTITAPIPDAADPFGVDVNHDVDYEALKVEMGKLGDIDIHVVESLSVKILAEKSKDIRALSFLAYATLRMGDFGRLADTICALADYCQDSYDDIFPRRDGAKSSALRWLSESRFTSACPKVEASTQDAEHVARLLGALKKLKAALEKRFASVGAPFPLLLYKRALEWESAIKSAVDAELRSSVPTYGGVETAVGENTGLVLAESSGSGQNAGFGDKSPNRPVNAGINADGRREIARCLKRIAEVLEMGI